MTPEQIAAGLSWAQRHGLLNAYPLSGPSNTLMVNDGHDFEALYAHDEELVTWTGRLLPLGLAVRAILIEESDNA